LIGQWISGAEIGQFVRSIDELGWGNKKAAAELPHSK
jgi:hypothetical protein